MAENKPRGETAGISLEERMAGSDSEVELTRDEMFHVLQCRRRRLVLEYLREYDGEGSARISDIAERIAAFEHGTTVDALRSQQRQRVYIALYQSHLPKLDSVDVVDYDQARGLVGRTELTSRLDPYLDEEPSLFPDGGEDD